MVVDMDDAETAALVARLLARADAIDAEYALGAVGLGDPELLREAAAEIHRLRGALDDAEWEAMGEDL